MPVAIAFTRLSAIALLRKLWPTRISPTDGLEARCYKSMVSAKIVPRTMGLISALLSLAVRCYCFACLNLAQVAAFGLSEGSPPPLTALGMILLRPEC